MSENCQNQKTEYRIAEYGSNQIAMSIMYLIFSFNIGGIERLLVDQCNGMARRGHQVTLCIINEDYTDSILQKLSPSVDVCMLHRPEGGRLITYMSDLANIVQKKKIEVLHCQGMNCVLFSLLAKARRRKICVLNTVHDAGNYSSYSDWKIRVSNHILDKTIAISDSVREEILTRKMDPDKVITIHNAIDSERFHYIDRRNRGILRDREVHIVQVARFFPKKKGQDILLQAVESLLLRYPKLFLTFAGAPAKGQEKLYDEMKQEVIRKEIVSHISFAGNLDDVPTLLAKADLFVMPSNYEGFGISLIEAMATGLPCVASDLEGPKEIMTGAKNAGVKAGLLVPAGDAKALASSLDQMIQTFEQYDGKQISDYTRQTYGMEHFLDLHEKLYESLIQSRERVK